MPEITFRMPAADELRIPICELRAAFEACWDAETSFENVSEPGNPALGQCYAISRVLQDLYPELEIVEGEVSTGTTVEAHFWNVLVTDGNEHHIDLTWQQFPSGSTVRGFRIRDRHALGDRPVTIARCDLLMSRVVAYLAGKNGVAAQPLNLGQSVVLTFHADLAALAEVPTRGSALKIACNYESQSRGRIMLTHLWFSVSLSALTLIASNSTCADVSTASASLMATDRYTKRKEPDENATKTLVRSAQAYHDSETAGKTTYADVSAIKKTDGASTISMWLYMLLDPEQQRNTRPVPGLSAVPEEDLAAFGEGFGSNNKDGEKITEGQFEIIVIQNENGTTGFTITDTVEKTSRTHNPLKNDAKRPPPPRK